MERELSVNDMQAYRALIKKINSGSKISLEDIDFALGIYNHEFTKGTISESQLTKDTVDGVNIFSPGEDSYDRLVTLEIK